MSILPFSIIAFVGTQGGTTGLSIILFGAPALIILVISSIFNFVTDISNNKSSHPYLLATPLLGVAWAIFDKIVLKQNDRPQLWLLGAGIILLTLFILLGNDYLSVPGGVPTMTVIAAIWLISLIASASSFIFNTGD